MLASPSNLATCSSHYSRLLIVIVSTISLSSLRKHRHSIVGQACDVLLATNLQYPENDSRAASVVRTDKKSNATRSLRPRRENRK